MPGKLIEIDRRTLLKSIFVIGAGSVMGDSVLAHCDAPTITRPFWEQLEAGVLFKQSQQIQQMLEAKFGIRIMKGEDVEAMAARFQVSPELLRQSVRYRIDWETPQLKALDSILTLVPSHFYAPEQLENGLFPLRFALYDNLEFDWRTLEINHNIFSKVIHDDEGSEVQFDKYFLTQIVFHKNRALETGTHELTHYVTHKPDFREQELSRRTAIGLPTERELRRTFASIIVEENAFSLRSWSKHIGYGAKDFFEFWSVAAEYFIEGREEFMTAYAEFMDKNNVDILYEIVRDDIFKGQEYIHKLPQDNVALAIWKKEEQGSKD